MTPRRIVALCLTLTFCFLLQSVLAKAGPEIPKSAITLQDALQRAEKKLLATLSQERSAPELKKYHEDVILERADYVKEWDTGRGDFPGKNRFKELHEWCWVFTFVHRVQNDHSWSFAVRRDAVELLQSSR